MKPTKSYKGSALILAIMLLFVMMTLAVAIIMYETTSRSIFIKTRTEAIENQAVQRALQLLGEQFKNETAPPTAQFKYEYIPDEVGGDTSFKFNLTGEYSTGNSIYNPPPQNAGKDYDNVPEGDYYSAALKNGYRGIKVAPWHHLVVMKSSAKDYMDIGNTSGENNYIALFSSAFPYAAFAPGPSTSPASDVGKIQLGQVTGYANPQMDKTQTLSGVPVEIYARRNVVVNGSFAHGRIYSRYGPVTASPGSGCIAFSACKREWDYAGKIQKQLDSALKYYTGDSSVADSVKSPEKSAFLTNENIFTINTFLDGDNTSKQVVSLKQALAVPFPIIPVLSSYSYWVSSMSYWTLYYVYIVSLHCPYPPDAYAGSPAQTRAQDELYGSLPMFCYGSIGGTAYSDLALLFLRLRVGGGMTPHQYALNNYTNVRVVHFSKSSESTWDSDFFKSGTADGYPNGFKMKCSWTVPKGKTLRLGNISEGRRCNVTIVGDLWLQDGALLFVDGDLTIKSPTGSPASVKSPAGRLIMGHGSILTVSGNLIIEGTSTYGSVYVTDTPNKVNQITSGILCKGNIRIDNGMVPASTLVQVASWIAADPNMATQKDLLQRISDYAPSIAKAGGPFHRRLSYFAMYPATFAYTTVTPLITPYLSMSENVQRTIFRNGVSPGFAIVLNAYLGEYLFAHCDWWPFDEGSLPVIPKVEAVSTLSSIGSLSSPGTSDDLVAKATNIVNNSLASDLFSSIDSTLRLKIGQDFCTPVLTTVYNYFVWSFQVLAQANGALAPFQSVLSARGLSSEPSAGISLGVQYTAGLTTAYSAVSTKVSQYQTAGGGGFKEMPGVLVYAAGDINLTSKACSGLFIAKGNINSTAGVVTGCMMSLEKNITAPNTILRYYPYFTTASLYLPTQVAGSTNDELCWNDMHIITGQKSNRTPLEIGVKYVHILTEGWDRQ
ncbi:MAG: hypothetical protein LWY06_07720 [Firmicutes bacterium]|nr:hypothetical protein [Bacillota bacterium]